MKPPKMPTKSALKDGDVPSKLWTFPGGYPFWWTTGTFKPDIRKLWRCAWLKPNTNYTWLCTLYIYTYVHIIIYLYIIYLYICTLNVLYRPYSNIFPFKHPRKPVVWRRAMRFPAPSCIKSAACGEPLRASPWETIGKWWFNQQECGILDGFIIIIKHIQNPNWWLY